MSKREFPPCPKCGTDEPWRKYRARRYSSRDHYFPDPRRYCYLSAHADAPHFDLECRACSYGWTVPE